MSTFGNIGHSLSTAVERFITIGEIIAEENNDIKADMYEAAKDARDAGINLLYPSSISYPKYSSTFTY